MSPAESLGSLGFPVVPPAQQSVTVTQVTVWRSSSGKLGELATLHEVPSQCSISGCPRPPDAVGSVLPTAQHDDTDAHVTPASPVPVGALTIVQEEPSHCSMMLSASSGFENCVPA